VHVQSVLLAFTLTRPAALDGGLFLSCIMARAAAPIATRFAAAAGGSGTEDGTRRHRAKKSAGILPYARLKGAVAAAGLGAS
jgi:hypothetical protein